MFRRRRSRGRSPWIAFGPWQCEQYWLKRLRPSGTTSARPSNGLTGTAAASSAARAAHSPASEARHTKTASGTMTVFPAVVVTRCPRPRGAAGISPAAPPPLGAAARAASVARSIGQLERHHEAALGAGVDDLLSDLSEERRRALDAAGHHRQVLLAVQHVGHRALEDAGAHVELPEDRAGLRVEGLQVAPGVAVEDQPARRRHRASEKRQVLLDAPRRALLHRVP